MLSGVAELMENGLDPSCGQFGAIGGKMVGEAPEVLAAVIEVQGFGRLAEAVLDQVPYGWPNAGPSRLQNSAPSTLKYSVPL